MFANTTILGQLIRYTFVGGLAFVVDLGSLYVLTEFAGVHYLISSAIAFTLGLFVNYFMSIKWVFDKRSFASQKMEFLIFGVIGIFGLFLNEFIIWLFTEEFKFFYINSKIVSAVVVYFCNFFLRRYILFNSDHKTKK